MLTSGIIKNEYGDISIGRNVIASYAGVVAVESFGIVGMTAANISDGIVRILKKDHLSHGIEVEIDNNNGLYFTFHIITSYGVSIGTVVDNLRDNVKYQLEAFTGMSVKEINVRVEGIRAID